MPFLRGLFWGILVLIAGRCTVETASAPEQGTLVIASDYLQEADTLLFEKFSKINKIKISILPMEASVIIQRLRQQGENSGIDLIMVESERDVHQMHVDKLLQSVNFEKNYPTEQQKYSSDHYRYIGFGLDPFVTVQHGSQKLNTYNDLTRHPFVDQLSNGDIVAFLAPVSRKMERAKAQSWISKYVETGLRSSNLPDSVLIDFPVLSKRSQYLALKDSSALYKGKQMSILRSGGAGSFYNLRTFCLAGQCENYTSACTFINYFMNEAKNAPLCRALHLVPIGSPGSVFRPYKTPTEDLLPYYTMVERTLERLGID